MPTACKQANILAVITTGPRCEHKPIARSNPRHPRVYATAKVTEANPCKDHEPHRAAHGGQGWKPGLQIQAFMDWDVRMVG